MKLQITCEDCGPVSFPECPASCECPCHTEGYSLEEDMDEVIHADLFKILHAQQSEALRAYHAARGEGAQADAPNERDEGRE